MRAVDTNVLVRYVANDDPKQAEVIDRLFEECQKNLEPVFIPLLVVCELFWILDRSFGLPKGQLIETLEKLLAVEFFRFDRESSVREALEQYRRGKATFPDYVIGETGRQAGCRDTLTFDRDQRGSPGFTILR